MKKRERESGNQAETRSQKKKYLMWKFLQGREKEEGKPFLEKLTFPFIFFPSHYKRIASTVHY